MTFFGKFWANIYYNSYEFMTNHEFYDQYEVMNFMNFYEICQDKRIAK